MNTVLCNGPTILGATATTSHKCDLCIGKKFIGFTEKQEIMIPTSTGYRRTGYIVASPLFGRPGDIKIIKIDDHDLTNSEVLCYLGVSTQEELQEMLYDHLSAGQENLAHWL
jgi:hypothetical protein